MYYTSKYNEKFKYCFKYNSSMVQFNTVKLLKITIKHKVINNAAKFKNVCASLFYKNIVEPKKQFVFQEMFHAKFKF